jgi:mevalonate kinase
MVELNVSDAILDALVSRARAEIDVTAAKISGSGLGDCILAMGRVPPQHQLAPFTKEGFVLHE